MDQRKSAGFALELPVVVARLGARPTSLVGRTRNLSSRVVLFVANTEPDVGSSMEYVITLSRDRNHAVSIRCVGTVLKVSAVGNGSQHEISASLDRYEFRRSQ